MKYAVLLVLIFNVNFGMQRVVMLQTLADEKVDLTKKIITDACNAFKLSNTKYDKILTSKALWGLAAAWDNTFGNDGIELAKLLINAGANPKEQVRIEEIARSKRKDGTNCYVPMGEYYETSAWNAAHGTLKEYFQSLSLAS